MHASASHPHPARGPILLALVLSAYLCARILEVLPSSLPRTSIVALDVLSALAFALLHGARQLGLRPIAVFTFLCILVGNLVENLGVATGFPFGRYYFVQLMGPKLFHVPILLGLAYIGMSWVSFTVARALLPPATLRAPGVRFLALPALAAVIVTSWDLAQDPVWSTLLHGWIWLDGGRWFGVPLSNYAGWLANVFLIYLLFTLYLRRNSALAARPIAARPAIVFYALCALGNVLQLIPRQSPAIVLDPTGHPWSAAAIVRASASVSILLMGGFVGLAWRRAQPPAQATSAADENLPPQPA